MTAERDTRGTPRRKRTTVLLDADLLAEAKRLTGLRTNSEVLEEALRRLVAAHRLGLLRDLRGAVVWDGDLAERRADWFGDVGA